MSPGARTNSTDSPGCRSAGAHKCIGMQFGTLEVKAILHQMLRTYTWTVPNDYHVRWDNTSLPIPWTDCL